MKHILVTLVSTVTLLITIPRISTEEQQKSIQTNNPFLKLPHYSTLEQLTSLAGNDENALLSVYESTGIVLLYFNKPQCPACQSMPIILNRILNNYPHIYVISVNTERFSSLTKNYQIRGVPTILFFKDGILKERNIGRATYNELENIIKAL